MSEKRSGLREAVTVRATQHLNAVVATGGGPRAWAVRLAGGGAVAGTGLALLVKFPHIPWYVGVVLLLVGLDRATNGIVVRGIKAAVDIYKDYKGTPPPPAP